MGEIGSRDSDENIGLILSQSPISGEGVAPGTPVNIVVAQMIPLTTVPDLSHREENAAIQILENARLQLGTVSEQESEVASGIILAQTPPAGSQVKADTTVNVTISHLIERTLVLAVDNPTPKVGKHVDFYAHLEPSTDQGHFKFMFGDGVVSDWTRNPKINHAYLSKGSYTVTVLANVGKTSLQDGLSINVNSTAIWYLMSATGILIVVGSLSAAIAILHGRNLFRKWIRLVCIVDPGKPHVTRAESKSDSPIVRIRLVDSMDEREVNVTLNHHTGEGRNHD